MTSLTASRLLAIWERGLNRPLLWKTHELLAAAFPGLDKWTAGTLSIGERDARLLIVREYLFGSSLLNMAACPQCGRPVEWEVNTSDIRVQKPHDPEPDRSFTLESGDYQIRFRLPNGYDIEEILALNQQSGSSPSAAQLLERCILSASARGKAGAPKKVPIEKLPVDVRELICRRMEAEDPQADIDMLLECPYCEHSWNVCFDIAGYLWEEIHRWALRMLHTVHLLARTYHWQEREILDMSPRRRRMYLQMIDGDG